MKQNHIMLNKKLKRILNMKIFIKKYSFVNITFEFLLTVKKEYRTFYSQTNLGNVNGYTILRVILSEYLFNKNYTFKILNTC